MVLHQKNIFVIENETEYDAAVAEVERLFGAEPGSVEAEQFVHLATLVEAYEKKHHAIAVPSAEAAHQYEIIRGVFTAA